MSDPICQSLASIGAVHSHYQGVINAAIEHIENLQEENAMFREVIGEENVKAIMALKQLKGAMEKLGVR